MKNNALWNLVAENDKKLFELATYYETKGFILSTATSGISEKILARYAEFKHRILIGSLTLGKLEIDVLTKFGVTEGAQYVSAPAEVLPKDIKKMIEELHVEER